MRTLLVWIARLAGVLGIATIAVAFGVRLAGAHWLGSFQIGTILQVGMAAVLVACLAYVAILVEWPDERSR